MSAKDRYLEGAEESKGPEPVVIPVAELSEGARIVLDFARNSLENPSIKETFLLTLQDNSSDLRAVFPELFDLCLGQYLTHGAGPQDINLAIFNQLLQRKDTQRYLGDGYIWESAKLFNLPSDSFKFFVNKFFLVTETSSSLTENLARRFRWDLITSGVSSKQIGLMQEKLLEAILSLKDWDCKAAILSEAATPGTSLWKCFDSSKKSKKALAGALKAIPLVEPPAFSKSEPLTCSIQSKILGSFVVYTSSSLDECYSAEAKATADAKAIESVQNNIVWGQTQVGSLHDNL
jgi:hypothetical protein